MRLLKDKPEAEIERTANIDEKIQHPIITILRSYLSEREPMGHWKIAPARVTANNNIEISKTDKFIVTA